ncbi:MAG: hypothetical protein ABSG43_01030 [Solirubrobacteraceae bacterium]|jgi:hypothetical protein
MVIPTGVMRRLDRDDERATRAGSGGAYTHNRLSTIPLALWLEDQIRGRPRVDYRGILCDLGWGDLSDEAAIRRLHRIRRQLPWISLEHVEDWLTGTSVLLADLYPEAAEKLEQESEAMESSDGLSRSFPTDAGDQRVGGGR